MSPVTDNPLVSICIPHWQVREMITICLRAIRKYTPSIPIEIIVVDNGSQDDSLEYLRKLSWIRLIERGSQTPKNWVKAFITALDIGLENSRGEYYVIMHTDTIIKRPDWLERLIAGLGDDPQCAAAGAWKLEKDRPIYTLIKKATDTKKARLWLRRVFLRDSHARQRKRELCPRDYCALYRGEPIRRFGLRFDDEGSKWRGYTAAERMYYQLKEHGYSANTLPTREMMRYMEHIAHATAGLRPQQRHLNHWRAQKKVERKLRKFFQTPLIKDLRENNALDE